MTCDVCSRDVAKLVTSARWGVGAGAVHTCWARLRDQAGEYLLIADPAPGCCLAPPRVGGARPHGIPVHSMVLP